MAALAAEVLGADPFSGAVLVFRSSEARPVEEASDAESSVAEIDPGEAYDPRLANDRLLPGLKGTMSEYELSLLRQRGIEARDGKARRGELRFTLPPGYCWSEDDGDCQRA